MVIKDIDAIDARLEQLESLLSLAKTSAQKKHIQSEIQNLKKGYAGEKEVAYHLNQIFEGSFIAHDLRINVDGEVAQIDHININRFGVVKLFETKNFSNDIKIDDEGIFHYYDRYKKSYRPFPSPIEQSKRHERVLKKAFEQINFTPLDYMHFAVFDYKAKIHKPKKGYENVCHPDMIGKANTQEASKVGFAETFKLLGNTAKKLSNRDGLTSNEALEELVKRFHEPVSIDYMAKFSIEPTIIETVEDVDSSADKPTVTEYEHLTLSKAAKQIGMTTKELENLLVEKGFLEMSDKEFLVVTPLGKENGIQWRKGKFGYYFLIPQDQLPKTD